MKINIQITGITPLMMNKFNCDTHLEVQDKNLSPREQAEKVAFLDKDQKLYYPSINIYNSIMDAGKFHKIGKNKITTQKSTLIPCGIFLECPEFLYFTTPTPWEVDTRSVVIPSTGGRIIKHRPRLDIWALEFVLGVDTKIFNPKLVRTLVDDSGSKIGLGEYRPQRKGFYGRFKVTSWKEKKDD